jgi:hypothetical protein
MRRSFRAVLAGALVGLGLGVCVQALGCLSAEERRAVSVADCVAQLALGLPDRRLPRSPSEVTSDDLALAALVVDGVWLCRNAGGAVFTAVDPFVEADGGAR